jgi:UDP-3-O-[3-hydroxymyristoyl] glucosamine N-acyltransferase LpxD
MNELDVRETTLRWWNGKAVAVNYYGGVLLAPWGTDASHFSSRVVYVEDPKMAFIEAVEQLYPKGAYRKAEVVPGVGVEIHPTAVIGKDGFGYHKGRRFPHVGGVLLYDGVHIGAHTCVDRGTLGNTVIMARTKVDNLVHIAHNVRIGMDCTIVAGTVIGGSAVIGDRVFIGINASIKNGVRIGNGATIGMGAVVLHDVPAGETWVGNPARPLATRHSPLATQ